MLDCTSLSGHPFCSDVSPGCLRRVTSPGRGPPQCSPGLWQASTRLRRLAPNDIKRGTNVLLYQAFAAALRKHRIDVVFGLMGDANMLYLCDFQDRGGRFVPATHECSAVAMADAWSRMTGRVGVVSVTHGPAATNTLTALVEAVRSRSRVLLVTGETPLEPTHLQRIDLAALAATAGAAYDKVYRPASLVRDLNRAMQRVMAENRPVVFDVPIGMLRKEAGEQVPVVGAVPAPPPVIDPERLQEALGLVASAKRPVILAGRGAVAAGARDELIELSGRLGAPLATTLLAREYFRDHPSCVGICGTLSHSVAIATIADADCVIAFGASLNIFTAYHGRLLNGKKIVQVDRDPAAFGWYTRVAEAVPGDAKAVAAAMIRALDEAGHEPARTWLRNVQHAVAKHDIAAEFSDQSSADTVDVRTASLRLDRVLPSRRVVVSDVGRYVVGVWPYLRVADPGDFAAMGSFGAIGLGLAGAIGAAIARPGDLTVAVLGDGGFMMSMAELSTAVRERLPLLVLVFDDGAYGAEYDKLVRFGIDPGYSLNACPDPVRVAEAMGARGTVVRRADEIDSLATVVDQLDGPHLVDIKLDPNVNVLS